MNRIEELLRRRLATHYRILTDMGYGKGDYVAMPVRSANMARDIVLNQVFASLRIPVEWSFGRVDALWGGLKYIKKIREAPIAKWLHIGVLLTNCMTCLYGTACSTYYEVLPPTLEEYLNTL